MTPTRPSRPPEPARLRALHEGHVAALARAYARAMTEHGRDALVVHSGSALRRTAYDDQFLPLRPVPHFQHWAPLAEPDCAMVIEAGKRPRLVRLRCTSFWEKPAAPETDVWRDTLEVVEVDDVLRARDHFPAGRVAFVGEDRARAAAWGFAEEAIVPALPPAGGPKDGPLLGLAWALDELRTTKTDYEIACLAEANRRAALGHRELHAAFARGDESELDLHLLYLRATAQDDPETPYKNIVAAGENAATLHHVSYSRSRAASGSLLVDAGATYLGYCADITRTWVKGTGATVDLFGALVARVEAMQLRLCDAARVGQPYESLHDDAVRGVGAILCELGIAKASVDEIVSRGVARAFFPHGLGHSLGLQTHDVGCARVQPKPENPFLRNTTLVAERQVFTIEPGVYFIEGLLAPLRGGDDAALVDWRTVEALRALGGVRIEDDLVVGAERTARNLTREELPVGGGIARA